MEAKHFAIVNSIKFYLGLYLYFRYIMWIMGGTFSEFVTSRKCQYRSVNQHITAWIYVFFKLYKLLTKIKKLYISIRSSYKKFIWTL